MARRGFDDVERWFVRRGLPHFIADYSADTDVWTRSLPVLAVVYVLLALNGLDIDWSWWQNLGAFAITIGILVVTWMVANVVRGRPPLTRPRVVGRPELAVFVLGPALPSLALGGQWGDAGKTVLEGLVALVVVYAVVSYGIVEMTLWAIGRVGAQFFALATLLAKALPVLTIFVTFLFLTNEVWQTAGVLYGPAYWLLLALFVLADALFLLIRVPRDIGDLSSFESWSALRSLAAETPAAAYPTPGDGRPDVPPLSRRQWTNVVLVLLFSQGVQIALVALIVGAFCVGFGFLAITEPTVADWTHTADVNVLFTAHLGGRELELTEPLLRVAGFLSAFAALNFTVYLVTDPAFREEFRDEVVTEIRQAFAVRILYLAHRYSGAKSTV